MDLDKIYYCIIIFILDTPTQNSGLLCEKSLNKKCLVFITVIFTTIIFAYKSYPNKLWKICMYMDKHESLRIQI